MISCFDLRNVFLLFRSLTLTYLFLGLVMQSLDRLLIWLGFTLPNFPLSIKLLAVIEHFGDFGLIPFLFIGHFFDSRIVLCITARVSICDNRALRSYFCGTRFLACRCVGSYIAVESFDNIYDLELV